jgi:CheY-like chemotaxis protein
VSRIERHGATSLPARFLGVFDPRGRAEALDARFSRLMGTVAGDRWRIARLDGRNAAADPYARFLRAAVLTPHSCQEPPELLFRRDQGRLAFGCARLVSGSLPREGAKVGPLAAAAADLDQILEAEGQGGLAEVSAGPARLEGGFAAAIVKADEPALLLVRDAVGEVPLHVARLADGTVAFSDWLPPLRALPEIPSEPDMDRVRMFMAFRRLPDGGTVWPGIREVPPGACEAFGAEGSHTAARRRAWGADGALAGRSGPEILEELRARARSAVLERWRRVGATPALAFSGGLDSSLLAGILCSAFPEQEILGWASVGSHDRAAGDEAARAAMARHWPNLRLADVPMAGLDPLEGAEQAWRLRAAPNVNYFAYAQNELGLQVAAAGHDSLLTGMNGDHLVSKRVQSKLYEDVLALRFAEARRELAALGGGRRRSAGRALAAALVKRSGAYDLLRRCHPRPGLLGLMPFAADRTERAYWQSLGLSVSPRLFRSVHDEELAALDDVLPWTLQDRHVFDGPGPPSVTLATASPLMDTRLASAVLAAPLELRTRHGLTRGIARALLEEVAPPEIVRRADKSPFQPDYLHHARLALPRFRAAFARFEGLRAWRSEVDGPRLHAAVESLERRPAFSAYVICMLAFFLGEFLERVETREAVESL